MSGTRNHSLAVAIEATEFPELSRSYRVMAVPKIVINDRVEFEVREGPKGLQAANVTKV